MAITDNNFTPEELTAVITAKPELISHITNVLSSKKYAVRSEEDDASYKANIESQAVSGYTSRVATEVEKTIKEITGIEKTQNEKWTDYYQRATKTVVGSKAQIESELTELKGKSNLTEAERNQLNDLKSQNQNLLTETENIKKGYEQKIVKLTASREIQSQIESVKSRLNKNPQLSKAIEIVSNQAIKEMLDSAQIDDNGKVVFVKDGKFLTDKNLKPITAADIYSEKMADFIDKGKQVSGAGGGSNNDNPSGILPAGVKTQNDLNRYFNSLGIVSGSKKMNEEFAKVNGYSLPLR